MTVTHQETNKEDNDGMKLKAENLELKNQIRRLEEELRSCRAALQFASERADIDFLTGIYNRNGVTRLIDGYLSSEDTEPCALCFLDLDNFKQINDKYGHQYGDDVLCSVVQTICENVYADDLVGRFGGDEFLILMRAFGEELDAAKRAEAICRAIREENAGHALTASIGISLCPQDGKEFMELLEKADRALYRSKDGGKNQIYFYENTGTRDE